MTILRVRHVLARAFAACWLTFAVWLYAAPNTATPMLPEAKLALLGAQNGTGCPFTGNRECITNQNCVLPAGAGAFGCIGTCQPNQIACGVQPGGNPAGPYQQDVPNGNAGYTNLQSSCSADCGKTNGEPNCPGGCFTSAGKVGVCIDMASCTCVTMQGYNNNQPYCTDTGFADDTMSPACFILP